MQFPASSAADKLPIADCQLPIERRDTRIFNWQSAIDHLPALAVTMPLQNPATIP